MWNYHHTLDKDALFAKQLLFAGHQSGKRTFPDNNSGWHFDDKVGQKYLLESIRAPIAQPRVFYDKKEAIDWIGTTDFPKVFKLRGARVPPMLSLFRTTRKQYDLSRDRLEEGFLLMIKSKT
mgnify:FL=1